MELAPARTLDGQEHPAARPAAQQPLGLFGLELPGGQAVYSRQAVAGQYAGFGGRGKYRKSRLGTDLYFSSQDELRQLFQPHFEITDLRTVEIPGKFEPHIFNYVFMERK